MTIEWVDESGNNGGRPAWSHAVGLRYHRDYTPGVEVAVGQAQFGKWRILLILGSDGGRRSFDFDGEAAARDAASRLVEALYLLWPASPMPGREGP